MHPGLEVEWRSIVGREGQPLLSAEDRPEARDRTPEYSHDRVADRLDQRAILLGDRFPQHPEVVLNPPKGGRVTDLSVEVGRVSEVGEEDGQIAHRDVLSRPE